MTGQCVVIDSPETFAPVIARLGALAEVLVAAAAGLPGEIGDWSGPAATLSARLLRLQPARFEAAAAVCAEAAEALRAHTRTLAGCRSLLRHAEVQRATGPAGEVAADAAQRQAGAEAAASARRVAGHLALLADRAPRRPSRAVRALDHVWTAGAEVGLGAWESAVELAALASRFSPGRQLTDPRGWTSDLASTARGLAASLHDPVRLGKDLLDWDTWATNPARAVGHLAPDALAGVAGAGAATVTSRSAPALQRAAGQAAARRLGVDEAAGLARERLVRGLDDDLRDADRRAWSGEGGRLTPAQHAIVAAYHRRMDALSGAVTERMELLARHLRTELAGLDNKVKQADSLKRKVAEALAEQPDVVDVVTGQGDTLRYTVVLPEERYSAGALAAAARMEADGLAPTGWKNYWESPRYRGINSVWTDPATGARFELQFHTPLTWQATRTTHPWFEDYRLSTTPPEVKAELARKIAAEYAKAPLPPGVTRVTPEAAAAAAVPPPAPRAVEAALAGVLVTTGAGAVSTDPGAPRDDPPE